MAEQNRNYILGFDRKLVLDWDLGIPKLEQRLQDAAPVGRRNDQWHDPGRFARSIEARRVADRVPTVNIRSFVPYSYIQVFGGIIPARHSKGSKPMRFKIGNRWISKHSVGPAKIRGNRFIWKAIRDWLYLDVTVRWASG